MFSDYSFANDIVPFIADWVAQDIVKGVMIFIVGISLAVFGTKAFLSLWWNK